MKGSHQGYKDGRMNEGRENRGRGNEVRGSKSRGNEGRGGVKSARRDASFRGGGMSENKTTPAIKQKA